MPGKLTEYPGGKHTAGTEDGGVMGKPIPDSCRHGKRICDRADRKSGFEPRVSVSEVTFSFEAETVVANITFERREEELW